MTLISIAFGGALGAVARYGMGGWIHSLPGVGVPVGTFVVNMLGSFLIGFSLRYLEVLAIAPEARAALTIGFLGAFTTFSAFSFEAVALIREGQWGRAAAYSGGSVIVGLLAVGAGLALASVLVRARG